MVERAAGTKIFRQISKNDAEFLRSRTSTSRQHVRRNARTFNTKWASADKRECEVTHASDDNQKIYRVHGCNNHSANHDNCWDPRDTEHDVVACFRSYIKSILTLLHFLIGRSFRIRPLALIPLAHQPFFNSHFTVAKLFRIAWELSKFLVQEEDKKVITYH